MKTYIFPLFLTIFLSYQLFPQNSTSITLDWNGAQSQGCCDVCGNDYWCVNNNKLFGCGTGNATDSKNFTDPVPAGNIITSVTVTYYGTSCKANIIRSYINGVQICSTSGNYNCSCGGCDAYTCTGSFSCGLPNYNYGGTNTFTVAPDDAFCFDRVVITFNYTLASNIVPAQPGPISGPNSLCPGQSVTATYSISSVPGATSYNWTVPAGWTINSGQGTTSINVTAGSSGGNICVTASNSCGTSSPSCISVTISSPLGTPGAISGPTNVCSGSSQIYSISPVSGATSYNWTVPAGWTINSGQGTTGINVTAGSSGGNICVTASNSCGTSSPSCISVSATSVPPQPGSITGFSSVCAGQTENYSISSVSGATSYTWTVPAGASINSGQGTTSINVTFGSSSGNICVTANNSCGSSTPSCKSITVTSPPATPGSITGNTTVCPNTSEIYSISPVSGATSYNWVVPSGWTITSGIGTTTITVTTGSSGGNICVSASNSCGTSASSCITVVIGSAPNQPGPISGNTTVCPNSSETYSISPVSGATSYNWAVPSSWTINSGQGTTSINITTGTSGGNICVDASNACGTSPQSCVTITMSGTPATPGPITGSTDVCSGDNATYSISPVSGATSYTWTVPSDATINSGQGTTSINVKFGTNSGNVCVTANNTCGSSSPSCLVVTVYSPSVGGTVLQDDTVCSGSNSGTLSLTGQNGSVIQWQSSTDNGLTWTIIANTSTTYNYNNLTDTTQFRAVVQNGTCPADTSSIATITVIPAVNGGTLLSSATVCSGNNSDTLVLVGYSGTIDHWEFSTDGGATWDTILNTTDTLSYNNLTVTTWYRVVLTAGGGGPCPDNVSSIAAITVSPPTQAGTVLSDTTVCGEVNYGTLYLSGYVGTILNWEYSTDGGSTWTMLSNNADSLTFINLSVTTMYRAHVKSGVCSDAYSIPATVTVDPPSDAGILSANAKVCAGANADTLTLTGYTGNISSWEYSTDGGLTWISVANTSDTLSYNNLTTTTIYHTIVLNGVCSADTSNNVTIQVDPITIPGTVLSSDTVCAGSNSDTLVLSSYTGTILNWEISTDGGNTWIPISNSTNNQIYSNLTTTTLYRVLVQSGVCSSAYSDTAIITVVPQSVGGTITGGDVSVCSDTNSGVLTLTSYTGNILYWEYSTDGGATWITIPNTTATQTYNNLSTTTMYRAIVQSGNCAPDTSTIAFVIVSPATIGGTVLNDDTVCGGSNFGTLSLQGNTGLVLNWEYSTDGGLTWNVLSNNSDTLSFSNITTTTMYRALVQSGVCPSEYSSFATIYVDSPSNAGTLFSSNTVCSGNNADTLQLSGYNGTILQWISSTTGGASWVTIANTSDTLSYNNIQTTTMYAVIVKNGVCPNDTSASALITVSPQSVGGQLISDAIVCSGMNYDTLQLTGYTGTIQGWEFSTDGGNTWVNIANTTSTQIYNNLTTTTMYRVLVKSGVCPGVYSDTVTITVDPMSVAGDLLSDATVCSNTNGDTLLLINHTGNVIKWEFSIDGGNTWSNADTINIPGPSGNYPDSLEYNNLISTTLYRAIVKSGMCPADTSLPVKITVLTPGSIIAFDDRVTIKGGTNANINVTQNDTGDWNVLTIISAPANGLATNNGDGTISYIPGSNFLGIDSLIYTICNDACSVCDTAKVIIYVGVFVPDGFSPDGDNINDVFVITGLDQYPNNELLIFNRWGDLVYKSSPYKNDWDGTSSKVALKLVGNKLVEGTYFYVLKLGDGNPTLNGYIELRRKGQ